MARVKENRPYIQADNATPGEYRGLHTHAGAAHLVVDIKCQSLSAPATVRDVSVSCNATARREDEY